LTPAQQESLTPKALLLQDVAEDYEFDSEQLDADYQRYRNAQTLYPQSRYEGNIPNLDARQEREQLREKLGRFLRQRQAYAKEVAGLVDEIRADLTAEQQLVFDTLEPPKLELPKALKQLQRDQFMRIPGVHGARPDDF
jgi:hypothetical protein